MWSPPTRCLRNTSKACGRQMSSVSFTVNEASLAPFTSTSLHSLFCGVLSTGDGVAYTGLAPLDTGAPPLFNGVPFGSRRSALNWWSSAGCATGGAGEEAAEVAAGGGELVAGEAELGAGWCPSGAAESRAGAAGVAMVVMSENEETKVNFKVNCLRK